MFCLLVGPLSVSGCGRRDVAEIPSRSPAGSVLFFLYCLFLVFIVVSLNFLFTFN